jgi:hypothetical protein
MSLPKPTGKVHRIAEIEKMDGEKQLAAIKNYAAAAWHVCDDEKLPTAGTAYIAAYYTPNIDTLKSADKTADAERRAKKAAGQPNA